MNNESVMTTSNWIVTILLLMIPCVGTILMFVWAFSENVNPNKKNLCRAYLIISAVVFAVTILFYVLAAILGVAIFGALMDPSMW